MNLNNTFTSFKLSSLKSQYINLITSSLGVWITTITGVMARELRSQNNFLA
jgi:hypothetical protein